VKQRSRWNVLLYPVLPVSGAHHNSSAKEHSTCDDVDIVGRASPDAMNQFFGAALLVDDGIGSDVAKRIAAPLWRGLISLTILTLAVIPALYVVWRELELRYKKTRTTER
jgi:hypothetical protein